MPAVAAGAIYKNQRAKAAYKRAQERIARQKTIEGAITVTSLPPGGEVAAPDAPETHAQAAYDKAFAYVDAKIKAREKRGSKSEGPATASVVLSPDASPTKPQWTLCDALPPAVLVDVDSAGGAQAPTNDMLADMLDAIRGAGATVLYTASAPQGSVGTLATDLMVAGLGPAEPGKTLFVVGDKGTSTKDGLRWKLASTHCILAQLGDNRSDFSDWFGPYAKPDAIAAASAAPAIAGLEGSGWFIMRALGSGK